jgi:hypothetical protein
MPKKRSLERRGYCLSHRSKRVAKCRLQLEGGLWLHSRSCPLHEQPPPLPLWHPSASYERSPYSSISFHLPPSGPRNNQPVSPSSRAPSPLSRMELEGAQQRNDRICSTGWGRFGSGATVSACWAAEVPVECTETGGCSNWRVTRAFFCDVEQREWSK